MPSGVHLYIQRDFFRVQGVATSVLTVYGHYWTIFPVFIISSYQHLFTCAPFASLHVLWQRTYTKLFLQKKKKGLRKAEIVFNNFSYALMDFYVDFYSASRWSSSFLFSISKALYNSWQRSMDITKKFKNLLHLS